MYSFYLANTVSYCKAQVICLFFHFHKKSKRRLRSLIQKIFSFSLSTGQELVLSCDQKRKQVLKVHWLPTLEKYLIQPMIDFQKNRSSDLNNMARDEGRLLATSSLARPLRGLKSSLARKPLRSSCSKSKPMTNKSNIVIAC